jgi:hypothetical protein
VTLGEFLDMLETVGLGTGPGPDRDREILVRDTSGVSADSPVAEVIVTPGPETPIVLQMAD